MTSFLTPSYKTTCFKRVRMGENGGNQDRGQQGNKQTSAWADREADRRTKRWMGWWRIVEERNRKSWTLLLLLRQAVLTWGVFPNTLSLHTHTHGHSAYRKKLLPGGTKWNWDRVWCFCPDEVTVDFSTNIKRRLLCCGGGGACSNK